MSKPPVQARTQLFLQLRWFTRLRWVAGGLVTLLGLADWLYLGWYNEGPRLVAVGLVVLFYNALLAQLIVRLPQKRNTLLPLAMAQIVLDLSCLTALSLDSGGVLSPAARFFVLHMVFASLLLTRRLAYASAFLAVSMFATALVISGQWPSENLTQTLVFVAWAMTQIITVFISNHITQSLRAKQRKLRIQNRHIRKLARQLKQQQQALIQSEKMAAMGTMAAGVAHEIANPLASMDSVLQLMQRKPQNIEPQRIVTIREQVTRIQQIVRQLTTFAHPTEVNNQVMLVSELLDHALDILHFDHRLRQVEVIRQYGPEAGKAVMQPHAMEQVLVNLLINALDAMAEVAKPQLVLSAQRNARKIEIRIRDNGHGIAPEHQRRLFEPFFTTKPVGKGTGLGLSISYSLMHNQGGQINLESQIGQGTTVILTLPAAAATPAPNSITTATTAPAGNSPSNPGSDPTRHGPAAGGSSPSD